MSASTEIVKAKPIVKICLAYDFTTSVGGMYVDFSHKLNTRGTDFIVYANTGYRPNDLDSKMYIKARISGIEIAYAKAENTAIAAISPEAAKTGGSAVPGSTRRPIGRWCAD